MRFCVPTTVTIDYDTTKGSDGRLSYKLSGASTETYIEFMDFLDRMFYNRTYHFSSVVGQCLLRLINNESDVETSFYSYYEKLSIFTVPVPEMVTKTSLIAGFNVNFSAEPRQAFVTIEDNLTMLEAPVYLWSLLLVSLFILMITCKVSLFTARTRLQLQRFIGFRKKRILRRRLRMNLIRMIAEQIILTFRGSSRMTRWISFLFSILFFFVITSLLCVYSTNKIVVEEPFIVKSYQDLLDRGPALPYFYDVVDKVSDQFQLAPSHTMKGKVWKKLNGRDASHYILDGKDSANPRQIVLNVLESMLKDNSVFVASSLISNMLKTFGCGSSPDGSSGGPEEFWRLVVSTDPHEQEDIAGWAVSNRVKDTRFYARRVKRLFQSGILVNFFVKMTDATRFAAYLAGTSARHMQEAKHVCSDDFKMGKEQKIQPVKLHYYKIFRRIFIVVAIASFTLLIGEKVVARFRRGRRESWKRKSWKRSVIERSRRKKYC